MAITAGSSETDREMGSKTDNPNKNALPIPSLENNNQTQPPKKKKPIQHLLAGGAAGFVESSVCHPLDTVKTRMQLRRNNTLRKRALGSLREVTVRKADRAATTSITSNKKSVDSLGLTGAKSYGVKGDAAKSDIELKVKTKPGLSKTILSRGADHHDVGWKQRLPPGSSATIETAQKTSTAAAHETSSALKVATSGTTTIKSSANTVATTATTAPTANNVVVAPLGPFGTARRIVQREGPMALYKGLTAVYTGIIPKMAIRFVSFEHYRDILGAWHGQFFNMQAASASATPLHHPPAVTFFAGLLAGLTEAVAIVTPAEVCKIRMQSQYHSLLDPTQTSHAKYKNVIQTAVLVVQEEGLGALYKGVVPTMLRQGCNQAVNFTAYNWSKKQLLAWKRKKQMERTISGEGGTSATGPVKLDHWQTLLLGGLSGGMGPLANNPLDVVKTRMQKQVIHPGKEPKYKSLLQSCVIIAREEGTPALWKGITPRLMRIIPGQALTFMTYEAVSSQMEKYGYFD